MMLKCDEYSKPSGRSVPLALCASTPFTRQCGLHLWGRSLVLPQSPRTTTTGMLCMCVKKDGEIVGHVPHKCSLLLYSGHFQLFAPCLHTCVCRCHTPDECYECVKMRHFLRAATTYVYCFALRQVWCPFEDSC